MDVFVNFKDLFLSVWEKGILGINFYEILIGIGIFLLFLIFRGIISKLIIKKLEIISKRTTNKLDDTFVSSLIGPARFLPIVLGFFFASYYMTFENDTREFVNNINRTLITILIFWVIHQIVEPVSYVLSGLGKILTRELISWIVKSIKILIFILGAAAVLELWGIKIGPIIAGLGLFGVAVALGAQDLFKNLISGIMILMEGRFTVGDVILVSNEVEGTVEQIGFRSTLVRRFDSTPVMVPNYKFAEQSVTNYTRRHHRRIRWLIGLEYRTNINQLKIIRDQISTLIENQKDFAKNENTNYFVRIDSFSESSIDMLVQTFTETNEWGEYLKIKESLAVKIIEIVENNKAGFAFPSQSIYVESISGDKPEIFNPKK